MILRFFKAVLPITDIAISCCLFLGQSPNLILRKDNTALENNATLMDNWDDAEGYYSMSILIHFYVCGIVAHPRFFSGLLYPCLHGSTNSHIL